MNAREKKRLRNIIEANARAFRRESRDLVHNVMLADLTPERQQAFRGRLVACAGLCANAAATLFEHVDAGEPV